MRAFRFRPIPFVATMLLVALGVSLGQWQDRRAAGKIAVQQQVDQAARAPALIVGGTPLEAAEVQHRRVSATGEFVAAWPILLDNRPQEGKGPGFYLLMPMRLAGTDTHVLVARGWLARPPGAAGLKPAIDTPSGPVTVTGVARSTMGKVMQLGSAPPVVPGAILQNIEVAQFAQASGLTLQPFFIEQSDPAQPGEALVRDWPAPSLGVEKHRGYAFQWYALAVMALLFFVTTGFRRGPT
ncbi:SURF1 family protein [Massilia soli]|uniref:SURF1-like protein n=1 Tax=Massilia soli TaxID=2792854 RepID=A0ABS7SSD6_9BURK|nr:SURF1 family protein [Massilia soli]MBZ2208868.1 SURF1 family protein [Massilia soli]